MIGRCLVSLFLCASFYVHMAKADLPEGFEEGYPTWRTSLEERKMMDAHLTRLIQTVENENRFYLRQEQHHGWTNATSPYKQVRDQLIEKSYMLWVLRDELRYAHPLTPLDQIFLEVLKIVNARKWG